MIRKVMLDYRKETMAMATGRSLPISTKHAIEISSFMRYKNLQKMKTFLEDVIHQKRAVPFKRFNKNVGHRPGIGPGRYPIKAAKEILNLLKSAEANAQFKGLNTSNLIIGHIKANKASASWHYGSSKRRGKMKRTNFDVILTEDNKKLKNKDKKNQEEKKGSENKESGEKKK